MTFEKYLEQIWRRNILIGKQASDEEKNQIVIRRTKNFVATELKDKNKQHTKRISQKSKESVKNIEKPYANSDDEKIHQIVEEIQQLSFQRHQYQKN